MTHRPTLDFLLHDWLRVDTLCERPRFADHSRETFDAVLDTCERLAREKFAPFNRLADTEEPRFDGERVHLPQATFRRPEGGYFLWVSLPEEEGHDVARITQEAAQRGVGIVPGTDFLLEGGHHALRLAYSAVTLDQVDEGVRRLADAVQAVRKQD